MSRAGCPIGLAGVSIKGSDAAAHNRVHTRPFARVAGGLLAVSFAKKRKPPRATGGRASQQAPAGEHEKKPKPTTRRILEEATVHVAW